MADANDKLQNALTVLQSVTPTFMPADGEVMTIVVEWPPGDHGLPPHRQRQLRALHGIDGTHNPRPRPQRPGRGGLRL